MPNPRRRANSMVLSIVDRPATRAEGAFSALVIAAMMISSFLLIAL